MSYINQVSITLTWVSDQEEDGIAHEIGRDMRGALTREFGNWWRAKGGVLSVHDSSEPRIKITSTVR